MSKTLLALEELLSPGGRRAVSGTVRGILSRIAPASENVVRANLAQDMSEIVKRTRGGGMTYDPLSRQFVKTLYDGGPQELQDTGYLMAPRPELPGARSNIAGMDDAALKAATQAAFARIANDPVVLARLRRGELLGSWMTNAKDQLVIDPSRRYLTRGGSLVAGRRSAQEAGFSPREGAYNVFQKDPVSGKILRDPVTGQPMLTPEAEEAISRYRMAQAIVIGALAGGGTAGVLSVGDALPMGG